jgi:hypothetical protein
MSSLCEEIEILRSIEQGQHLQGSQPVMFMPGNKSIKCPNFDPVMTEEPKSSATISAGNDFKAAMQIVTDRL